MRQLLAIVMMFASISGYSQTTFNRVYDILQSKCVSCHGGGAPSAGLNLSGTETQVYNAIVEVNPANATALAKGDKLVDKGYPDRSFLLRKVAHGLSADLQLSTGEGLDEPNTQAKLDDHEIEMIRQWIIYGAPQSGTPVNYQRIADYYNPAIGGIPKITRPPAPPAGQGFQIHMGPVFWAPGQEVEYFQKYDPRIGQNMEVYKYELYMNSESHHFILRQFDPGDAQNTADGLQDFNTDAFGRNFINAWQISADLELPVGTGFFYDASTVFDLNFHMKNYHQNDILPGEVYLNVYTRPRNTNTVEMKAELIPYLYLLIPGNQSTSFQDRVTRSGQTWNIWMLSTHTHKFGVDYDIFMGNSTNANDKIYEGYYDFNYVFNQGFYEWSHPPVKRFSPMLPVNMSSGLTHKATYNNTSPNLVTWSFQTTGEMMLIYVQYTTQSVNYKPPVNTSSTGTACNSVDLSTDGGLSVYHWSNGDTTQTTTVTQSGTYTVTVTDGSGSTYTSDPVTVTVINASVNINSGNDPSICNGQSAMLNAGNGFSQYAWSNGASSQTINVNAANSYSVTVTDANGCTASDNAVVSSSPNPTVSVNNEAFCAGGNAVLDAGNPGATYNWSTGATTGNITVNTAGNYSVTVTNAGGCSSSDVATVTVNPLPVVNVQDVSICQGSTATLNAGNPGASFAWSTGETTRTVQVTQVGTYTVTVTSAAGCVAIDDAILSFGGNLSVQLPDGGVCDGESLELDAGFTGASYIWSTGATTQTITITDANIYSVTVSDGNGCSGSDTATMYLFSKPEADAGESQVICEGTSVVLTATGGDSYMWTTGDATSSITVSQPGSYNVTVTAANGCTDADKVDVAFSLILTGNVSGSNHVLEGESAPYSVNDNSGSTYSWQVTNGTITSGQNSASVDIAWNVMGTGSVTVMETNADGCDGDPVSLQVNIGSTAIATIDGGKGLTIFPNPASTLFQIEFANPSNQQYNLRMFDITGKTVKEIVALTDEDVTIQRGNLSEGIYFLELTGEKTMRGKIIIAD